MGKNSQKENVENRCIFIPVAVYYVQAIQNCPAKGGAKMDTYEKLIAWGLQMSLRYQKYLQKIDYKVRLYEEAVKQGSFEKALKKISV